jgi:hypothetical protein
VLAQWVRTKLSLTVNGGTSVIIAWVIINVVSPCTQPAPFRTPPNGRPGGRKDPIARLAKRIAKFLTRFARKFFPKDPEEARVSLKAFLGDNIADLTLRGWLSSPT